MIIIVRRIIIREAVRSNAKKIGTKERGFEVELEILVKLIKKGARVAEIPFTSTDRQAGVSKFNVLSHGARYAKGLIRIIIYGGRNS